MINVDPFLNNGYLNIQGLDAKINSSFNAMKTYVNGIMDVRIVKQLLGAKLLDDKTGDLRHLLFFLIMIDSEREKDRQITAEEDWEPNSYYIDLFETEKLRNKYLCLLDNSIVDYLFTIFELNYIEISEIGIGDMIIEGTEMPFQIN